MQIVIYMGQQLVANSDSLPFEVEIPIPIMDDCVFHIRHICWIDSLPNYSDYTDSSRFWWLRY